MWRPVIPTVLIALTAACGQELPTAQSVDTHALAHSAPDGDTRLSAEVRAELAQVRRATARFHDIDKAMAAGYTVWSPNPFAPNATCPSNAKGQMGYHLVNVPLRGAASDPVNGDAVLDLERPEMLLYEKRADGKMHLVGVEYLVFTAAWERVHGAGAAPPTLLGQPVPPSTHSFTAGGPAIPHYELHVWLWEPNPLGMFYPWNPRVSC